MTDIKKYLESGYEHIIDYNKFSKNYASNDDEVFSNIRGFIANRVSDILLINIEEDTLFLTKKELKKLPSMIRHYLKYSECRGIKLYIFNTKDDNFKTAVGVFGWTTGRTNERYFDQIIADKEYEKITKIVSVKLTDLLKW